METNGWNSPQHFERSYLLRTHLMMDQSCRTNTPSPDQVSSAADAMLKLASTPHLPMYHMNQQPQVVYPPPGQQHLSQLSPNAQQPAMGHHQQVCAPPNSMVNNTHDLTIVEGEIQSDASIGRVLAGTLQRMSRKQREFTPDYKKDDSYWLKRRKNNEAAKRSREKRRYNDIAMGTKILDLSSDNDRLRRELQALKRKFGLPTEVDYYDELMDEEPSSPCPSNQSFSISEQQSPSVQTSHHTFKETQSSLERSEDQAGMPILGSMSSANDNFTVSQSGHYSTKEQEQPLSDYGSLSDNSFSTGSVSSNTSLSVSRVGVSGDHFEDERRHALLTDSNENGNEEDLKPLERSRERKGIPHKLRHKEQFLEPSSEAEQSPGESSSGCSSSSGLSLSYSNAGSNGSGSSIAGLLTTGEDTEPSPQSVEADVEERMSQPAGPEQDMNTSDSLTSGDSNELEGDASSQRLSDRRKRAAQVQARRCRNKDRKMMNNIQLSKSQLLESENSQLKEELRHLASEVNSLKEWMKQKSAADNCQPPGN